MSKELIQLISDNPDLPIFAWVNGEVCEDDSCYWLGKFDSASIREYAELGFSYGWHETNWVFKDETEDLEDYLLNTTEYLELSDSEADKKLEDFLNSLEYKKAIFVFVDTV